MDREVVWSYEAATDLEALAEFISRDSPVYAAAFAREMLDASRSLDRFFTRGRIVPELGNPDIRELLINAYRLIYLIETERVIILGLIHGKRDLDKLLE